MNRITLFHRYIAVRLPVGGSRAFTSVITLAAPAAAWADPLPAVSAAVKPYAEYFAKQYGSKPAYCPSNAVSAQFEQNEANFNRTYVARVFRHKLPAIDHPGQSCLWLPLLTHLDK